jgi:hypothetical protein
MMPFKMLLLPVRLVLGTAKVSAKVGYRTAKTGAVVGAKTAKGSAHAGYTAGRVVGYGRTAVFAAGVGVGIVIASPKARAALGRAGSTLWGLRQRAKGPSDQELAEHVRRRLARSQSTWQHDQPRVTVQGGIVRLDGVATDAEAKRTMGETTAEVDGVREVDNRVVVTANGASSTASARSTSGRPAAGAPPSSGNGATVDRP